MAHLERSPIDATECPVVRGRGRGNSRRSAAGKYLVRVLSPCLTVGILLCIAGVFSCARDHDGLDVVQ